MNNERMLEIAKENGAYILKGSHDVGVDDHLEFSGTTYLTTCAAIEKEVEKRVREEIAKQFEASYGEGCLSAEQVRSMKLSEEV